MIHQFIYARMREGYRQLNDWGGTGFSADDAAGMESLKKYALAGGMDSSNLPDCVYFYNTDCSIGKVGVVGKTSYVRPGSSRESGDRETSIIHKYIFSDEDYNLLLNKPKLIFDVRHFCETADNALAFDTGKIELERICKPNSSVGPVEMLEIINAFGLSEGDFVHFLYALMDVSCRIGKRVYLFLPSNDRNGSDAALMLCERIFTNLPAFVLRNCGFITYSDTFHNTTTNNIPGAISLVFTAGSENNTLKLSNISAESYVFDPKHLYTPKFNFDPYTAEMLEDMKKAILCGLGTNNYMAFYKSFNEKVGRDSAPPPEFVGAAYQFYSIYNALKNKDICIGSPSQVSGIMNAFLQNPDLIGKEINDDVVDYTQRLLSIKKGEILLDYIAGLYESYEPIKGMLVEKVCEQCRENVGASKDKQGLLNILERASSKSEEMLHKICERMYCSPRYYDQASLMVAINLEEWIKSDTGSSGGRIKKIFEGMSDLYGKYPGLVQHRTYIGYIFDVFKKIICINNSVDYDAVFALYDMASGFAVNRGCGIYFTSMCNLVSDVIGCMDISNITADDYEKLKKWKNTILKDIRSPSSQVLSSRLELYEVREYRVILEQSKIEKIVDFLSRKPVEEIANVFPYISNEVLSCITPDYKYSDEPKKYYYDWFNLILFSAVTATDTLKQLCAQILRKEGIFAMKRLYDNLTASIKAGKGTEVDMEMVKSVMRLSIYNELGLRYFDSFPNIEIEAFVRKTLGMLNPAEADVKNQTGRKTGKPFWKK